jgi:hypothetical protein
VDGSIRGFLLNLSLSVFGFLLAASALNLNWEPFSRVIDRRGIHGWAFLVRYIPLAQAARSLTAHEKIEMHYAGNYTRIPRSSISLVEQDSLSVNLPLSRRLEAWRKAVRFLFAILGNRYSARETKKIGAKGGTRTPTVLPARS